MLSETEAASLVCELLPNFRHYSSFIATMAVAVRATDKDLFLAGLNRLAPDLNGYFADNISQDLEAVMQLNTGPEKAWFSSRLRQFLGTHLVRGKVGRSHRRDLLKRARQFKEGLRRRADYCHADKLSVEVERLVRVGSNRAACRLLRQMWFNHVKTECSCSAFWDRCGYPYAVCACATGGYYKPLHRLLGIIRNFSDYRDRIGCYQDLRCAATEHLVRPILEAEIRKFMSYSDDALGKACSRRRMNLAVWALAYLPAAEAEELFMRLPSKGVYFSFDWQPFPANQRSWLFPWLYATYEKTIIEHWEGSAQGVAAYYALWLAVQLGVNRQVATGRLLLEQYVFTVGREIVRDGGHGLLELYLCAEALGLVSVEEMLGLIEGQHLFCRSAILQAKCELKTLGSWNEYIAYLRTEDSLVPNVLCTFWEHLLPFHPAFYSYSEHPYSQFVQRFTKACPD